MILSVLEQLSLPIEEPDTQTVIYRHLLSQQKPIPINSCQSYPHPNACQKAAEGLYVDRLRYARDTNNFPCDTLGNLDHQQHPVLQGEYQKFKQEVCR